MNFKKALSIAAITFLATPSVFAQDKTTTETTTESSSSSDIKPGGMFIEPMLTYQTGDVTVKWPSPLNESKEDLKGFGLGLRFGVHVYESLFLGVDGRYSKPTYHSSALNGDGSSDAYDAGLTLGVQTPLAGIRVWGTYIMTGALNPQEINSVDAKFSDLKGYRIGAGIYVKSVSINLEYQDATYDKTTIEKAGPLSGNLDGIDGQNKSYIVSLSFPVNL
ncbi:hypothetical protein DOM22_07055 [Bdellovibrio sp. ZAP7]|uniref:hypothetical protein n=1 Tax=Bdellovibrio sp. ZAP7 TaxID=2231053 RepID=UPI001158354F|nr:hypothetical protein [Bdellovibrio sp. ZAP7]QDK44937.1 hypothetical protein DOM22_07055 [Bdellovibrio sp. ZAP7]